MSAPAVSVVEAETDLVHAFVKSLTLTESRVFTAARECLSPHQLPARVHLLPELPVTEHGKTDLRHLRRLAAMAPSPRGKSSDGEIEQKIVEIWRSLVRSVPADEDNFLSAGGDSFSALALVNTLR